MIQLRSDCLVFETSSGEAIPCSAEEVTVELIGDAMSFLDRDLVTNAAAAVLHYFKNELERESVTVGEFTLALEKVLRGFGLQVKSAEAKDTGAVATARVTESDLRQLACESGKGFELLFFPRLRDEVKAQLSQSPRLLRFKGLRGCVKQLVGAQRWTGRCQLMSDQIVEFLRHCLTDEHGVTDCALVVQ
jgi:hypothetical protein